MNRVSMLVSVLALVIAVRPGHAQTGELRVGAGAMTGLGPDGSPAKPVTTASFSFVKGGFSFGPEVSYAFGEERIFGIGVVARLRVLPGRLQPYLVAGLGGDYWKLRTYVTAGLFTGSLGAGIHLTRSNTVGITVEARVHKKPAKLFRRWKLELRDPRGRHQAGLVTRLLRVLVLAVSAGTTHLPAQQAIPGRLDSASVVLLKPDRFVRIQAPELGRIQGHVGSRTATELVLQMDGESRRLDLAAVDTLWVRGRRTKTGAIIGGILGVAGGLFMGALAEGLCECDGDFLVGGAVFGAGAGVVTGAIIGTAIPRWRRVFPD